MLVMERELAWLLSSAGRPDVSSASRPDVDASSADRTDVSSTGRTDVEAVSGHIADGGLSPSVSAHTLSTFKVGLRWRTRNRT